MFRFITDLLFGVRENSSFELASANNSLGSARNSLSGNYFEYPSNDYLIAMQQQALRAIAERQYWIPTGAPLGQAGSMAYRVELAEAMIQQGIIHSPDEYFGLLHGTPRKEKEVIKYRRYK